MPNLNTKTECSDRGDNRHSGHPLHRREQSSSKTKAMKKSETKCDPEPRPSASTGRIEKILHRDKDDAGGNHRLHNAIGKSHYVEDGERQSERVRKGECRHHLQQIPHADHCEHKTRDKEQMVVSAKNMPNAVS